MRFFNHAMRRFDGETNVLWMDLQQNTQQAVLSAAQAGNAPGLTSSQEIEAAVSYASEALGGNLHLYWAFAEEFDGSRAPWVTYTPVEIDADKVTTLTAFDASGQSHKVTEEIAQSRPVIVITQNERTNEKGNVLPTNIEPTPPPPGGGGGGGGDDTIGDDYDDYPGFMALDWIRMYDPYEGWPNGGPEFHMTITRYDAAQERTVQVQGVRLWDQYDIDRDDCDGRKIILNKVIRDWHPEDYPSYSIQWIERDSDSSDWLYKYWIYDVPFELPAWADGTLEIVNHFIRKDSKDDILEHAVTNADDSPKYYGTGAPDFQLTLIEE